MILSIFVGGAKINNLISICIIGFLFCIRIKSAAIYFIIILQKQCFSASKLRKVKPGNNQEIKMRRGIVTESVILSLTRNSCFWSSILT